MVKVTSTMDRDGIPRWKVDCCLGTPLGCLVLPDAPPQGSQNDPRIRDGACDGKYLYLELFWAFGGQRPIWGFA